MWNFDLSRGVNDTFKLYMQLLKLQTDPEEAENLFSSMQTYLYRCGKVSSAEYSSIVLLAWNQALSRAKELGYPGTKTERRGLDR